MLLRLRDDDVIDDICPVGLPEEIGGLGSGRAVSAIDLYLMGRDQDHNVRRGSPTPWRLLADAHAGMLRHADRALGAAAQPHGLRLAVGNPADVVVFDAYTPEQAIAEIRNPPAAFKRGRQTMVRKPPELLRP